MGLEGGVDRDDLRGRGRLRECLRGRFKGVSREFVDRVG